MERGADLCENGREEGKEVRAGEREREGGGGSEEGGGQAYGETRGREGIKEVYEGRDGGGVGGGGRAGG